MSPERLSPMDGVGARPSDVVGAREGEEPSRIPATERLGEAGLPRNLRSPVILEEGREAGVPHDLARGQGLDLPAHHGVPWISG